MDGPCLDEEWNSRIHELTHELIHEMSRPPDGNHARESLWKMPHSTFATQSFRDGLPLPVSIPGG
jgi:hypothetical protein